MILSKNKRNNVFLYIKKIIKIVLLLLNNKYNFIMLKFKTFSYNFSSTCFWNGNNKILTSNSPLFPSNNYKTKKNGSSTIFFFLPIIFKWFLYNLYISLYFHNMIPLQTENNNHLFFFAKHFYFLIRFLNQNNIEISKLIRTWCRYNFWETTFTIIICK